MDLIASRPRPHRRVPAAAVAAALAGLAAGQTAALLRTPALPADVALVVPKEAFGFTSVGPELTVSFQLRNAGERAVRVTDVGRPVPGLALADVVVAGSPVRFRSVGAGAAAVPAFALAPGDAALVSLTYRLTACNEVPADARPVPVAVQDGRARGTVRVALPELPDDADGAADEDVVEWQQVLVRALCG